ncbi:Satratoxin biosynthesis SC1 cluster protein 4 [Lachnellula arida]|uniref:Satratoxin biosynthesis SC1 cluster protein 4 n=1 Tax=Lachnellula arida TaxID=1316785 RepID=A0A8T9BFE9_9HELO|nr:Satratoxin biosynthesis SC1 cluster protein 4 [Lachnellula arida]
MALSPDVLNAILNGPALDPPKGVTPNFHSHDSLAIYILPTVLVGLSISTVFLILRIYTKYFIIRSVSLEDYITILAWVMLVGFGVPCWYCVRVGGRHQWDTSVRDSIDLLYYANIVQILYGPTMFTVKLSILLQYMRIFVPRREGNTAMFVLIHIVLWADLAFYTVDTLLEIFSCNPRALNWNKLIDHGSCFNIEVLIISAGAINVVSDCVMLFLPMFSIWRLQLSTKKKAQISAVFACGLLACVSSVIRLAYSILLFKTEDRTYAFIPTGLWSVAEVSIGFICSCLPVVPKFFQVMSERLTTNKSSTTPSRSYYRSFDAQKSGASNNPGNPYDSRRALARGDEPFEGLELTEGVGSRHIDIRAGSRRPSGADEEGRILKTVSVEVNELWMG